MNITIQTHLTRAAGNLAGCETMDVEISDSTLTLEQQAELSDLLRKTYTLWWLHGVKEALIMEVAR